MTIEINPDTGLPVLPDDLYWHVAEAGSHYLTLTLRRRKMFGRYDALAYAVVHTLSWSSGFPAKNLEVLREEIRNKAVKIMESREEQARSSQDVASLVGDYPPKRLP